jgi:hypothetical protein
MGYFANTVAAYLAGQTINVAWLVEFDFTSVTVRCWQGYGAINAGGYSWDGIGELGAISGLESAIGAIAPQVSFQLSGVSPTLITEAMSASSEVKGRNVTVYIQFFDQAMQPLDNPYAIFCGLMDVMKVKADGPATRTIELTAEGLFSRRGVPPWGYLSASSQRALYPGDAALDMMQQMQNISTGWPWL